MRPTAKKALALVLFTGCASVDPKPAFDDVATIVSARSGLEPSWARSEAEEDAAAVTTRGLFEKTLDDMTASRIALLRNRALIAEIEELGIARADYAQATRLANPSVSAFRRTPSSGQGTNVELEVAQDLLDVLVQPARKHLAAVELEAAKLRLGHTMLDLVAEVRTAFFELVAAQEMADRTAQIRGLTSAAAELARRQRDAGTLGERDVSLFEAADAEAQLDQTRARLEEGVARECMQVLLGGAGEDAEWTSERRLPRPPDSEPELALLEHRAVSQRLDLAAARFGVDLIGKALALKRKTRFFPIGVEVGLNREKDTDGTRLRGPQIAIELPIFDTGAASIARLEAERRRAVQQLEQLTIETRSEVRLAREKLLGARALIETHDRVLLPKRRQVLEQTLLHYNMMLLGVYDLLLARREEVAAEQSATAALRDYWLARVHLERAVGGSLENVPAATLPSPTSSDATSRDHRSAEHSPGGSR